MARFILISAEVGAPPGTHSTNALTGRAMRPYRRKGA